MRTLTLILQDYRLERVLDPTGRRSTDLLDATLKWVTPPGWWPQTRWVLHRLDREAHEITGSMLRAVTRETIR
jgi:hypothetical protein